MPQEKTFSTYTPSQGKIYAESRRDYHPNLYNTILTQHITTGGEPGTLLDIGCGPGPATRGLAPFFKTSIGLDPSPGMISTARSLPNPQNIRFETSTAEEIGRNLNPPIPEGSIDLITAGTAAHWFDMSRFWPQAAKMLRPGGSVAIWTSSSMRVHHSVPNAVLIQKAIDEYEEKYLKPYFEPGNLLTRGLYRALPLPWTLETVEEAFDEKTFYRREWDGTEDEGEAYFLGQQTVTLEMLEKGLGTTSPVTRWREAHPEAVGTEQDVVKIIVGKIRRLVHKAGVEEGKEIIQGALRGVLLVVKKKA